MIIKTYPRLLLFFIILLFILVSCAKGEKTKHNQNIFDAMSPGYDFMEFLAEMEKKDIAEVSDSIDIKFGSIGFEAVKDIPLIVGNDTLSRPKGTFMWVNPKKSVSVYLREFQSNNDTNGEWQDFNDHIGTYTGIDMGGGGTFYLKLEPEIPSSLNATFFSGNKIFQVRKQLTFAPSDSFEFDDAQNQEVISANNDMIEALDALVDILVLERNKIYKPANGKSLTENERLFGFINFWTEVKYNFAFFDQVPNLDWQKVLMDYLPKVRKATSNLEYYRVLQEVCALLNDGHTNIYLPSELERNIGSPAIRITFLDGQLFVTNSDRQLEKTVPLGSQITEVNGIPVEEFIKKNIRPYISSSTEHIKRNMEAHQLLEGNRNDSVQIEIRTPENRLKQLSLSRESSDIDWVVPAEPWELSSFKKMGEIAYVSLNSFDSSRIVEEFESYLDSIQYSKGLIIDLRKNGGGNSWNGYNILKYLTDDPIITSKWKTRDHRPAFKAWGAFVDEESENLGSWDLETLSAYKDDYWFESGPDTISPNDRLIKLPTIVLIGNNTASAAEDFLVAADPLKNFETMGDYTYGSTGQPMFLRLPGGGKARICTKRDTYPDGREFVGYGIQPDITVAKTLEDFLKGDDSVLGEALIRLSKE